MNLRKATTIQKKMNTWRISSAGVSSGKCNLPIAVTRKKLSPGKLIEFLLLQYWFSSTLSKRTSHPASPDSVDLPKKSHFVCVCVCVRAPHSFLHAGSGVCNPESSTCSSGRRNPFLDIGHSLK